MEPRDSRPVEEAPHAAQEGEEDVVHRIEENEDQRRGEEEPVTGCAEESARSQPVGSRLPEGLVPEPSGRSHGLYLRLGDASANHDGSSRITLRRRSGWSRRWRVELTARVGYNSLGYIAPGVSYFFLFYFFNYIVFIGFQIHVFYRVHCTCHLLIPPSFEFHYHLHLPFFLFLLFFHI